MIYLLKCHTFLRCVFLLIVILFGYSQVAYAALNKTKTNDSSAKVELALNKRLSYWSFEEGIPQGKQFVVKGHVISDVTPTNQPRILIRIDHTTSHNYYSRFNHEQVLASGSFTVRIDMDQLKTGHRKPFASTESRRIYLKAFSGDIQFEEAYLIDKPIASEHIVGWDFSLNKQSAAWGFYSLTPTSTWVNIGGHSGNQPKQGFIKGTLRGRDRPYYDELINDGLEGIKQVKLPLKNGLWQVRLWTQDVGEWEYVPHPLNRTLRINQQVVLQESLTAEEWYSKYYFTPLNVSKAARQDYTQHRTSKLHHDFWQQIASIRGNPIDTVVEVKNGILQIDLLSDHPSGEFLSAVIATPWNANAETILSNFTNQREQLFFERWPIIAQPDRLKIDALSNLTEWGKTTPTFAKNELITLRITFSEDMGTLNQSLMPFKNMTWFQMTPMLNRIGGQENALTLKPYLASFTPENHFAKTGDTWIMTGEYDPLYQDRSNYNAFSHYPIASSKALNAATKTASLYFDNGQLSTHFNTLQSGSGKDISLPNTATPIGIYLDFAPHLSWFSQQAASQQANQDYQFIRNFGLTGVAPALPTPTADSNSILNFKRATQAPLLAGLVPPFPAYTPLKRMLGQSQQEQLETLKSLQSLNSLLLWSLADEPGLFPELDNNLLAMNKLISRFMPEMPRFAQLNQTHHAALADLYTDIAINQGYQITPARLERLKKSKKNYYLYNLPDLRFSAGLYLWQTQAKGFWQWHGRMPTAHPYDPTDGREDDVQFFLPLKSTASSANKKAQNHVIIRADLLNLRTGVNDFRWLQWLSQNAKRHIDFAILQQKIQLSLTKKELKTNKNNRLNKINLEIKQLAQRLQ